MRESAPAHGPDSLPSREAAASGSSAAAGDSVPRKSASRATKAKDPSSRRANVSVPAGAAGKRAHRRGVRGW